MLPFPADCIVGPREHGILPALCVHVQLEVEVDKVGPAPAAVLLEVLDLERQGRFRNSFVEPSFEWSIHQLQSGKLPADAREPKLVHTHAGVHDELVDLELGRLQYAADDPVRAAIDDATAELFGLSPETVAQWRTWLGQEPFMHNASPVPD